MPQDTIQERFGGIEPRQLIVPLLILILIIGTIIGIYNYQKNANLSNAPLLEITKPINNQEVTDIQIVLEGKTDSKATVTVDDRKVTVDKSGNFSTEVPLAEGANVITVKSVKGNGKNTVTQLNVIRVTPTAVVTTSGSNDVAIQGTTSLNQSGPENFWLPEASALAAAGTAFIASRKRLTKASKRKN